MSPFNGYRSIVPGFSTGEFAMVAMAAPPALSDDDIARRAYEKFLARGGTHGFDRDDWEDARRDLLEEALLTSRWKAGEFNA